MDSKLRPKKTGRKTRTRVLSRYTLYKQRFAYSVGNTEPGAYTYLNPSATRALHRTYPGSSFSITTRGRLQTFREIWRGGCVFFGEKSRRCTLSRKYIINIITSLCRTNVSVVVAAAAATRKCFNIISLRRRRWRPYKLKLVTK